MDSQEFLPDTCVKAFSPNILGFTRFEWVRKPTHIPQPRAIKVYGIEVVDARGNPVPFVVHPKSFKDALN